MKAIVTSGYTVPLKPELYEGLHVFRNMCIKQVKKKKITWGPSSTTPRSGGRGRSVVSSWPSWGT